MYTKSVELGNIEVGIVEGINNSGDEKIEKIKGKEDSISPDEKIKELKEQDYKIKKHAHLHPPKVWEEDNKFIKSSQFPSDSDINYPEKTIEPNIVLSYDMNELSIRKLHAYYIKSKNSNGTKIDVSESDREFMSKIISFYNDLGEIIRIDYDSFKTVVKKIRNDNPKEHQAKQEENEQND